VSCELVCVCVSLVRVVIICPASTHTALVSSPSLAVLHLSTYLTPTVYFRCTASFHVSLIARPTPSTDTPRQPTPPSQAQLPCAPPPHQRILPFFSPFAAPLCSLFPRRVTCAPFENFYFVILNSAVTVRHLRSIRRALQRNRLHRTPHESDRRLQITQRWNDFNGKHGPSAQNSSCLTPPWLNRVKANRHWADPSPTHTSRTNKVRIAGHRNGTAQR